MEPETKIIELPRRDAASPPDDRIVAAVLRLREQPVRQVNWAAVLTFLAIAGTALGAIILVPRTAEVGVRFAAAMALIVAIIMSMAAILYRHARAFWVEKPIRRSRSRR